MTMLVFEVGVGRRTGFCTLRGSSLEMTRQPVERNLRDMETLQNKDGTVVRRKEIIRYLFLLAGAFRLSAIFTFAF